jgi:hypothetical protein
MATGRSTALYGQLQVFSLNTILSALNLQKVTGHLTLAQFDHYAQILIKNGEVVDAWSETERGLNALLPLFGWEEGFFSFDVLPVETRTINISLPVLQVRSAVYLEEQKAVRSGAPPAAVPISAAAPVTAPAAPAASPPPPRSVFTREIPGGDYILQLNQESDSDVTIQPEHWTLLRFLMGGQTRTVNELADLTGRPLENIVTTTTQLVRGKMLKVIAPGQR